MDGYKFAKDLIDAFSHIFFFIWTDKKWFEIEDSCVYIKYFINRE